MNHLKIYRFQRAAESMKNNWELPNLMLFGKFSLLLLDYYPLSSSLLGVKQNMHVDVRHQFPFLLHLCETQ